MRKATLLCFIITFTLSAQKRVEKLLEYEASNGVMYKIGEEIQLDKGSGINGSFLFVSVGGWATATNPNGLRLGVGNSGLVVTIKKIKKYNYKNQRGVYFTVGGGNISNYTIDIENAISSCEIKNCAQTIKSEQSSQFLLYDKLKKLKELLDSGILTQDEYQEQKEKLLKQ